MGHDSGEFWHNVVLIVALDDVTEQRLLQNLRAMTDMTVVIVTHRKAALGICDRVLRFTEAGVEDVTEQNG